MKTLKFKVVAQDPTNNKFPFTRTFYAATKEYVEAEANLLFGTVNVISVELDSSPCKFDLWYENGTDNISNFYKKLYDAFMCADGVNREKLAKGFPEEFAGSTF